MKAPICWLGGKSRLRNTIIQRLPERRCYVEVFGGAGWVLFGKEVSRVEVYNDIDGDLVNFFRIIKTAHKAFIQAFDYILVSRTLFREFLNTSVEDLDEVQRAVRFYYIVKTSFGGQWSSPSFGYAKTSKSSLNLDAIYETITAVHKRLRRVYIEEEGYESILRRYDGEETFFYLDPPYFETAGYRHKLALGDYQRLAFTLSTIKGRFLLTINDHLTMRAVFMDYNIEEVQVPYSVGKVSSSRHAYGELMVSNY